MMKRAARQVDVPKLRRNLKNRSRIADTMCCGYLGGFAYLKFVLIWLVCIALDLLIGFRFELLYPMWLSIRNCYDSFRLQGLISSFHYSAFSVIFICATLASDLIFFVLLPVQILLFLASSYIWIQFAWQTGERGFGSVQLFLWIVLISFEYNWRYRGDSPIYLFLDSSVGSVINFLTGGLLSSLAGLRDSSSSSTACERGVSSLPECQLSSKEPSCMTSSLLGGFGAAITTAFAHSATFGSVLCRPFAAHCIGYPVVTLGFGFKTYMSLWRVKRRQREVSKENDFYGKLLAEALPSVYESAKMYPCSNGLLAEQDAVAEFETELPLSNLAICAPNSPSTAAPMRKSLRNVGSWKQQNGWRANGIANSKKGSQIESNLISSRREPSSAHDEDDSASNSSLPTTSRLTIWRFIWDFISNAVLFFVKGSGGESNLQLYDRISLSSNEVDSEEEVVEQDDNSQVDDGLNRLVTSRNVNNKRPKGNAVRTKGGRSRAAKSQIHTDLCLSIGASNGSPSTCSVNNVLPANSNQQEKHLCNSSSTSTVYASTSNGVCTTGSATTLNNSALYIAELETLREELRAVRCQESELRGHLQQATNAEKQAKSELLQAKTKFEQTDSKLSNCLKAREQDRSSMQLLEKRLIEAQTKVKELEKELASERKFKEQYARTSIQNAKSTECGEACKAKKTELDRELRLVRRELKLKEELNNSYEEKLKQLQEQNENVDVQKLQATVDALKSKCSLLEESLSSENSLKLKLFRSLNEARTQTESLQQQLRSKDIELAKARTRMVPDACERPKHLPVNNPHPSVALLRAPPGLPPPMTNGSLQNPLPSRKLSSSISNEHSMELLTAVLSNAASNAYRPYAFNGHTTSCDRSLFDTTPSGNAQVTKTSPATSLSPPPVSHITGKADGVESGRFSAGKFVSHGSSSTSVRST